MFSSMRNFFYRHRRKFIVGGTVFAGSLLALRYAQRKLIEYHEAKAKEFLERTRRTQHFETTERTCNQAIMGLASNLTDQILQHLDADRFVAELRQNPSNKIELWNLVKVLAISRLCALVYASSMLVITLRIQFNILGGYLYKDLIGGNAAITADIQQHYVALVQHFLRDGCQSLCQLIQTKVEQVLQTYDLSRKLTLAETEQMFWSIQMAINSDSKDPNNCLAEYVYPQDLSAYTSNPLFHQLYDETIDMLECGETSTLNAHNASRGFSIVMDQVADFYFKSSLNDDVVANGIDANHNNGIDESVPSTSKTSLDVKIDANPTNINAIHIPLPKLIPIFNGLAKQPFSNTERPPSLYTSLVTLFLISDKVKALGANVYEVFCQ